MSVCDGCPARIPDTISSFKSCVYGRAVHDHGAWVPPEECFLAPILKVLADAEDIEELSIGPIDRETQRQWVEFWVRRKK